MPSPEENIEELKVDMAVLKNEFKNINEKLTTLTDDINKMKGYFNKFIFGAFSIVGAYFLKWALSGGFTTISFLS